MTRRVSEVLEPFIAKFATRIDSGHCQPVRYDEVRQISQVCLDDRWVDAVAAHHHRQPDTRMTKVTNETTDDQ